MKGVLNFMVKIKKVKNIFMSALSIIYIFTLAACTNTQSASTNPSVQQQSMLQTENEIFDSVINSLKSDEAYAIITINSNQPILLAASSVYDDNNGKKLAAKSDVYYAKDGILKKTGEVKSMGTAYPLSYDESGIYAGSNNGMKRFNIDAVSGEIKLAEAVQVTYDKDGNAAYTKETDGRSETVTEEVYMELMQKYGKAATVNFTIAGK